MTIEITRRGIIASIIAAAVIIAAFMSGYRIGYDKRRQEIFDLECGLKIYGHWVDSIYCRISDNKEILYCQDDMYQIQHVFD